MSVVPTELTPGTLLKKAQPLFRLPLQTSSSPLFEIILSLFLTMSGIPALNLNLPIFDSSSGTLTNLNPSPPIPSHVLINITSYNIQRCCIHALVPTGSPSLRFVFPTFVRRDQTFLARRTGQRQHGSHQCYAARQILRAQTHHVNALES